MLGSELVGSEVIGSEVVGGSDGGQGSAQNRMRPLIMLSSLSVSVAQNDPTPLPTWAHSV